MSGRHAQDVDTPAIRVASESENVIIHNDFSSTIETVGRGTINFFLVQCINDEIYIHKNHFHLVYASAELQMPN